MLYRLGLIFYSSDCEKKDKIRFGRHNFNKRQNLVPKKVPNSDDVVLLGVSQLYS
jgi:hypothetical protein